MSKSVWRTRRQRMINSAAAILEYGLVTPHLQASRIVDDVLERIFALESVSKHEGLKQEILDELNTSIRSKV